MVKAHVALEGIILEQDDRVLIEKLKLCQLIINLETIVPVPDDAKRDVVASNVYDEYRLGLSSACADAVCVQSVGDKLVVPLIFRKNAPFGQTWWVVGGAIANFRPVHQFLLWKIFREYGKARQSLAEFVILNNIQETQNQIAGVRIVGCLGVYRTAAEDCLPGKIADTINLAYLGILPPDFAPLHDCDHCCVKLFDEDAIKQTSTGHWYPDRLVMRALSIVRRALEI